MYRRAEQPRRYIPMKYHPRIHQLGAVAAAAFLITGPAGAAVTPGGTLGDMAVFTSEEVLTDEDIADLSAFYAAQPGLFTVQY